MVIIAISSTGTTEKMILWRSLYVDVIRGSHGQACASGDVDQHELLPGHELDDLRGLPRRMRRPLMIVYT